MKIGISETLALVTTLILAAFFGYLSYLLFTDGDVYGAEGEAAITLSQLIQLQSQVFSGEVQIVEAGESSVKVAYSIENVSKDALAFDILQAHPQKSFLTQVSYYLIGGLSFMCAVIILVFGTLISCSVRRNRMLDESVDREPQ